MGHVSNRTSRIVASIIFFTLMWQSSAHGQQEQANGKLETASSTDGNLILNGGFDSNEAWQLQIHKGKGGVATLHFDHAARIVREKGGDAIWAIQLIQKSLRLKAKHRYRVSFRTRAENTTGFDFQVCKAGKPNLSYSKPESVNVTKDWAKIEHEFSMGDTADPAAKIAFSLGKGTGTIFLDDIRLEELGAADPADETASQKSKWIPDDVIKNLELEVSKREAINKPTNEQRLDLKDFEFKLDVAKYFEKQLVDTSLTNVATLENQKEKVDASDGDTFVIVKIKVPKKSQVAQIEFANFTGVAKCTTNLYYFAKGTPAGHYRDFRILGRFSDTKIAEEALEEVRRQYDAQKKEQAQMLVFIQRRAKQKKSRRRAIISQAFSGGGGGGSGSSNITSACRT